jgi:site-specific DNA-methyltransferase (adenine-specific)
LINNFNNGKIILGDCLDKMKDLSDKSIDLILCDLPYGVTACKWDSIIPFQPLWEQYERLIKDNGAIVLTATQPFTSALVMSNPKLFKYEWIWQKQQGTNPMMAKIMPMKIHENILVFYKNKPTYNPQYTHSTPYKGFSSDTSTIGEVYGKLKSKHRDNPTGQRYPISLIKFNTERNGHHPTQKPLSLMEYLILTYTNEGDLVLDNCMGSGSTCVAATILNRNFIGIEKEDKYFKIAKSRLEDIGKSINQ